MARKQIIMKATARNRPANPFSKLRKWVLADGKLADDSLIAASIANMETDIFRIDLGRVVSKYIGQTEKNLDRLFAEAENKEAILVIDEADDLFGKAASGRSHRYPEKIRKYLLRRLKKYPGTIVLAPASGDPGDDDKAK